jgi:hypothetical protein
VGTKDLNSEDLDSGSDQPGRNRFEEFGHEYFRMAICFLSLFPLGIRGKLGDEARVESI